MGWQKSSKSGAIECVEVWRKSTFSGDAGCVEIWQKSTFSGSGGTCVETAQVDGGVLVRDSKDPDGPRLGFDADEWNAFLRGAKAGEFDI
jgi:hypothetical protein